MVEGEEELSAYNTIEEALESCGTLIDFVMNDTTLLSISFDSEEKKLIPEQVDLKEIAKHYKGEE